MELNLTQHKQTFIGNTKILQHKINTKKLKPDLAASHDLMHGMEQAYSMAPRAHMDWMSLAITVHLSSL